MRIRQMGFSSRLKAHRHLLTLETLKFIVEYLVEPSTKGAAMRSGIPEAYASRQGTWLKKLPMVQRALETDIDDRDLRKLQAAIGDIEAKMELCKSILNIENDQSLELDAK